MKFIKTFESVKYQSNIEDLLLEFEDSGEINNVRVTGTNKFKVEFKFREDLVGLDKLKVLDKIISRLRRKYPYIYIKMNWLCVDLIKQNRKYITGSLVTEVQDILKEKLTGLNIFTSDKYPEYKFYGKTKENILLEYKMKNGALWVEYKTGWAIFNKQYMFEYADIAGLWQEAVVNTFHIEVNNTKHTPCPFALRL